MTRARSPLARWVEHAADVSRAPMRSFPPVDVLELLSDTFDAVARWSWIRADGTFGSRVLRPPPGWPPAEPVDLWAPDLLARSLLTWFASGSSAGPMPAEPARPAIAEGLRRACSDDSPRATELVIPVTATTSACSAFVLRRDERDLSAKDLLVARQIQPLLMLLDRLGRGSGDPARRRAAQWGLTRRESAVLRLLRDGLTADAMGRRLGCSPRTVGKHLEHLYRKLEVRDRLAAIRATDCLADRWEPALPSHPDDPGRLPAASLTWLGPDLLIVRGRLLDAPSPTDGVRVSAYSTAAPRGGTLGSRRTQSHPGPVHDA